VWISSKLKPQRPVRIVAYTDSLWQQGQSTVACSGQSNVVELHRLQMWEDLLGHHPCPHL
jgi:hypothetical protein